MQVNSTPFQYKEQKFEGHTIYPSELIQMDIETNLHLFLNSDPASIKNVVIVGAWRGEEIDSFLQYPQANIFCFEPNPTNFLYLKTKFSNNPRVQCFQYAIGSENGTIDLFETNITGNDSCLPVIDSARIKTTAKHSVELRTLDSIESLSNIKIDLLWMDVQGYELEVLKGAEKILLNCRAIFSEVGTNNPDYKDAVPYETLALYIKSKGFEHAAEGVSIGPNDVLAGNAYFLKDSIVLQKSTFNGFEIRLAEHIQKDFRRRKVLGSKISTLVSRFLPLSLKLKIKQVLKL